MTKLTKYQESQLEVYKDKWLSIGLSTEQRVGNNPNLSPDLINAIKGDKSTGIYRSVIPSNNEMYNFLVIFSC